METETERRIRQVLDDGPSSQLIYVPEPTDSLVADFHADPKPVIANAFRRRTLLVREMAAPMPWTGEWEMAYRWKVAVDQNAQGVPVVQGTPQPVRTGRKWWERLATAPW